MGEVQETSWKDVLGTQIPEAWANEIDTFEGQMVLANRGDLDEKVFAETRLRRGIYGQRYDNGKRHDGIADRELSYPSGEATKGPETLWDAPGMQRIKVPWGGLKPDQLEAVAQLADEYADGILHITTRQDFQLHFVHVGDTPDLMRRLAAVGITTREACGNSVRNVTACPLAGVCRTEVFDVTPYADALTYFLLGHDDVQDFGRKFKIAFSGCEHEGCGLVALHDLGFVARVREMEGRPVRGFDMYVGGGLGAIPHQAKLLAADVPETEILPLSQAVCRVFARLGEKRNRNRARIKFLVAELGIEEFTRLVHEERAVMPKDERWDDFLDTIESFTERPLHQPITIEAFYDDEGYQQWLQSNVYPQRQSGFSVVHVNLPLGDLTSWQAFGLADVARTYVGEHLRTTVEQNIVLRWVADQDLKEVYDELVRLGMAAPGAGTIHDITACPGTDTCKLGIASSRGLAGELSTRLASQRDDLPESIRNLKIKISGCFNSCGQHHVADIGFFGNSRHRNRRTVPHFQVVLGGQWKHNAGSYGLPVGAVPSRSVPDVLDVLTRKFDAERNEDESFQDWVQRYGKKEIRGLLKPFSTIPLYENDASYYSDWGDPREFTIGDIGVGECAGEVVSLFTMEVSRAEAEALEALVALDEGQIGVAYERAVQAMVLGARSLLRGQAVDIGHDEEDIVKQFRERFFDTELFFDKFAKGKFGQYLFKHHRRRLENPSHDQAHETIEEAHLFIEAAYACDGRIAAQEASQGIQL